MHRPATSRRGFLASLCIPCFASEPGKGRLFPSAVKRYPDPATEFPMARLTDPHCTSLLPPNYAHPISRRDTFLIYASNQSGSFEAFSLDFRTGQSRQLTESEKFDPASFTLYSADRLLAHFDGPRLLSTTLNSLHSRELYRLPEPFTPAGLAISEDSQFAVIIEKSESKNRLTLIPLNGGTPQQLVESDQELAGPIPRPRRASILYRRAGEVWLVNYDARQNYRLKLAPGQTGPARWSPDGRTVLYLNYPDDPHKLHALREFTPDTNQDNLVAETTQYISFAPNADASVFLGASGAKASPYVLLLVRAVRRELTLAEHHSSDTSIVNPFFSSDSQRIFFGSDRDGKPALYTMSVTRLVEETK